MTGGTRRARPWLIAVPFALLAVWKVWHVYSYWADELFSVTISQAQAHDFIVRWVLNDVHPPLYQALLKVWMLAFGAGEPATRALSTLSALGALCATAWATRGRGWVFQLAAIGLLGGASAFAYYAQETRSYALMLCLATVATHQWLAQRKGPASFPGTDFAVLLALSLTHYFGLLLALLLLAARSLRPLPGHARVLLLACGLLMATWPALHGVFGSLGSVTGGNFWIEHTGVASTLQAYADGVFPWPYMLLGAVTDVAGRGWALGVCVGLASAVCVGLLWSLRDGHREPAGLALLLLAYLATVAAIDHHSPVSTPRNYIVLLPASTFLLAFVADAWARRLAPLRLGWLVTAGLSVLVIGSAMHSQSRLATRWEPHQNVRDVYQALAASDACRPHCRITDGLDLFASYGSATLLNRPLSLVGTSLGAVRADPDLQSCPASWPSSTDDLPAPCTPIVVWWMPMTEVPGLAAEGWHCAQPQQGWPGAIAVLHRGAVPLPGLNPCK